MGNDCQSPLVIKRAHRATDAFNHLLARAGNLIARGCSDQARADRGVCESGMPIAVHAHVTFSQYDEAPRARATEPFGAVDEAEPAVR